MPATPPPASPPHDLASHDVEKSFSCVDTYFQELLHSPEDSDSDSESSQITLEDTGVYAQFGYPLQRMERAGTTNGEGLFDGTPSRGSTSSFVSCSSWSSSSSVSYAIDYEKLVDHLLEDNPNFNTNCSDMILVEPSLPEFRDSLMVKCLTRNSAELYLILELNHKELRSDPWNPIPHLRGSIERDDNVYLCMERLNPFDQPPFKTVSNYIDFFRQILEGLTFLHELQIANLTFHDPTCFMVDLSSAPSNCESLVDFDRTEYPVRYYFTNLHHAKKYDDILLSEESASVFTHDIQECGTMIEKMLTHVPRIELKMKSLVKAMTVNGFGAEDARKLFEALCKSFEASTLDTTTSASQGSPSTPTLSLPKRSTPQFFLPPS
ncbi:hypothetical protein E4T56_gene1144 [Termitomyces sp. T112]|nr:hypothetical protein E4T56_gene1144 [Termitomyces sp. T112]